MKKYQLLLLMVLCFSLRGFTQKASQVHIVTKKRNLSQYEKFNFNLNGIAYKLNDGQCLDMTLNTDSIHVEIFDKTVFRKKTVYDLRIAATDEVYLFIYLTFEGAFKSGKLVAEVICEACYKELKAKCK
jgi:hypothetical protein